MIPIPRTTKNVAELKEIYDLLNELYLSFGQVVESQNQTTDPPAILIQYGFFFVQRTTNAMILLLETDEQNALLTATLSRSAFELSIRLLWASKHPNGWDRLEIYWANETKKWAEKAKDMPECVDHAQKLLQAHQEYPISMDVTGKPLSAAPDLRQMLETIEQINIAEGYMKEGLNDALFEYVGIYGLLCHISHVHLDALPDPHPHADKFLGIAIYGIIKAYLALLQASSIITEQNPQPNIEEFGQRMVTIIQKYRISKNIT